MNKFLFSLTAIVVMLLVVKEMTPVTGALTCSRDHCNGIQCSTPYCEGIPDGRYRLKQPGPCDCCPFCVKVIGRLSSRILIINY